MRGLAALFLGLVPVCYGFHLAAEEKRRTRDLSGILELLLHVRYEIGAFLTRRADLFCRFECPSLEASGFLPALRTACKLDSDNPLYETLLSEGESLLLLSKEDRRILLHYAAHLGEFDAAEELLRAERTRDLLSESLQKQKEEEKNRVRLYRAFGIVLGLAVMLFVW